MIEPVPYALNPLSKRLATADFETDPFRHGRVPRPFCVGFYNGVDSERRVFWGADCARQLLNHLDEEAKQGHTYCTYMHNGGRFDFMYLLSDVCFGSDFRVVNGRIIQAHFGREGHEFRDSFALFPQALKAFKKEPIQMEWLEADVREQHRAPIEHYCIHDCVYLWQLLDPFLSEFGDKLTIGSVAMAQLNSLYGFERLDEGDDAELRKFFFGGRVQCFETGDFRGGDFAMYDANGMYSGIMKHVKHPISGYSNGRRIIDGKTGFAIINATSRGCLPWRDPETKKLEFPHRRGEFYASIHEINAGLELGLLDIHRVERAYNFEHWTTFAAFVDKFYDLRQAAKQVGDEARDLIYKRVGNSGYGKFALDPRDFEEFYVSASSATPPDGVLWTGTEETRDGWVPTRGIEDPYQIWARPEGRRFKKFHNVATASSITGGGRANLMHALAGCGRPMACDTDGIILDVREGADLDIDPRRLAAWKPEIEGCNRVAIAGRKLYAMWGLCNDPKHKELEIGEYGCIKKASKGARLTGEQIAAVARGEEVTWLSDAPNFHYARPTGINRPLTEKEAKRLFTLRKIKRGVEYWPHTENEAEAPEFEFVDA